MGWKWNTPRPAGFILIINDTQLARQVVCASHQILGYSHNLSHWVEFSSFPWLPALVSECTLYNSWYRQLAGKIR